MIDQQLQAEASRLSRDDGFQYLLMARLSMLKGEIVDMSDEKEVLKAHKEYNAIRDFAEWVAQIGEV